MTPPHVATAALRSSTATLPATPRASLTVVDREAERLPGVRYCAAAVVVPPLGVYAVSIALLTAAAAGRYPGASGLALETTFLTALLLPVLAAAVTVVRGLGKPRIADWMLLPTSAVLAWILAAVLPGPQVPPLIQLLAAAVAAAAVPITHAWSRRWERCDEREATLVLPRTSHAAPALARLRRIPGLRITSLVVPGSHERRTAPVPDLPVFTRAVRALSRDRTAIVSCPGRDPAVEGVVAQLVARGYTVTSESAVLRESEGRIDSDLACPLNLLLSHPSGGFKELAYRVRDLLVAVPALILLAPLFALVALAIRLDSKGPAFFLQRRLGARGRPFRVIKFRTMRRDAEAGTGPVWASEHDPRITRLGAWLRRTRVDELPQLVNVALGQMSLVGPRPERAHFFRKLRSDIPMFELRTALRPGLTGWAQVRGTYASDTDEARTKLGHDLYYFTQRSLWFDLAILLETFTVALSGRGAR